MIQKAVDATRWLTGLGPVLLGSDPLVACRLEGPLVPGSPRVRVLFAGRRSRLSALDALFRHPEEPAVVGELARGWRAARAAVGAEEPYDALLTERGLGLDHPRAGCTLRFHPHVLSHLGVLPSMEQQLAAVPSERLRKALTRMWQQRRAWRVARTAEEFTWFYEALYRPFAQLRFGPRATLEPRARLEAAWRRHGSLLLVGDGPEPPAATLFLRPRLSPGTLYCWKSGFAVDAKGRLMDDYMTVLETAILAFAVEERATTLGLGVTSAVLSDGVFQRNGRLGCHFTPAPGDHGFSLHLPPAGAAGLLRRVPLLAMGKEGWEGWWGFCPPDSTAKELLDALGATLFSGVRTANIVGLDETLDPALVRDLERFGERRGVRVRRWREVASPTGALLAPSPS